MDYLAVCKSCFAEAQADAEMPEKVFCVLKQKLSEADYLEVEELLNDAFAQVQEDAFFKGCRVLPELIKGLMA